MTMLALSDLESQGISVSEHHGALRVSAVPGAITPNLRVRLATSKPALVRALIDRRQGLVDTLRAHADASGIDPLLIDTLPDDDLDACVGQSNDILRTYVRALADSEMREQGQCPADETEPALCTHCGPVFLSPAVCDVLPIVDRIPTALVCPFCRVKNRSFPRPTVTCGACKNFVHDHINPPHGCGHCTAGCEVDSPRPTFKRTCVEWRSLTRALENDHADP